jgi:hypothetical protein
MPDETECADERFEVKIERGKRGRFRVTVRTSGGFRSISRGQTAAEACAYIARMVRVFLNLGGD